MKKAVWSSRFWFSWWLSAAAYALPALASLERSPSGQVDAAALAAATPAATQAIAKPGPELLKPAPAGSACPGPRGS